jgi:hypothetical protein
MDASEPRWIELYRAALMEFDREKLSGRIAEAQAAIDARIRELTVYANNHHGERQALADAINGLKVLRADEKKY